MMCGSPIIYDISKEVFLLSDTPSYVPGYAVVNIENKKVYLLDVYTPIQLDDDIIQIGVDTMLFCNLAVYKQSEELMDIINQDPSQIIIKNTLQKIPSVDNNYPPYTKIMVNFLLMKGKEKPLPKEQHTTKCGLIRELIRTIETQKEMSLNKMQTLMEFYELSLKDIFKDAYII